MKLLTAVAEIAMAVEKMLCGGFYYKFNDYHILSHLLTPAMKQLCLDFSCATPKKGVAQRTTNARFWSESIAKTMPNLYEFYKLFPNNL